MINPHQFRAPEKPRWPAGPFSAPMGKNIYEAPKAPSQFWLNAGARNIRSTTQEAQRCRFMRPIRRRFLTRNADYILSAVVLATMILYAVT